ncbi:MAG: TonB-dependent receptor [Parasphingorhabdus sp.]|uniref:TonB-dependent receptor domain-containing protein n=1 Tax=Parasphingorhabdus sp. TaxID=2709688 RepID=UPI00329948FD
MLISHKKICALLCTTAMVSVGSGSAFAQDTAAQEAAADDENVIVVTGTQIKGAKIDDVLPVTVLNELAIETTGASSGDELFRAIPQAGAVAFNDQSTVGGVNGARGDIASINLRALGTGNTLLLINGRRMVLNPGFQTELFVPVVSPDTNTIPPGGVRRVEVLRDGASAVYGADAVAGVVNTHLKDKLDGGFLRANYRASTGTSLYSSSIRGGYGFDFNEGRTNLTLYGYYFHENGAPATIRDYARNSDRRGFFSGTDFDGDTQLDNRSTDSPFGQFDIQASRNATLIGDDDFFTQPDTFSGCNIDLGGGICANSGTTISRDIRYDIAAERQLFSEKDRYNVQALFSHELSDAVEFYFEGSYYRSESNRNLEQRSNLNAQPIGILATAFYNPFGATTLPDGSPNPNRLPAALIPGIGAGGADVQLEDYRPVDIGQRNISVNKDTFRIVAGLEGDLWGWDFDTGFVYSEAKTTDLTRNRFSLTGLQDAINRTDATAYNPFNGGCLPTATTTPNSGDCTPSVESALDAARIDVSRIGKTSLALADFKVSKPDLFALPGGDVGVALGVEFRRETFSDDRDDRLDGTISFTNAITGDVVGVTNPTTGIVASSDVAGSSPSPDTNGSREVYSGFAEAFIPLVSEDMDIPLISELNLQLAGRFEHFSDISETTVVPRAALSWTPVQGIILRGAWSRGFRAPNLVQVNDTGTTRSNSEIHAVECVAEILSGAEDDVGDCGTSGTIDFRTGGNNLEPEKTESINLGVVFSPEFIPGLTLTADYWRVRQDGIVGIFGGQNAILLDLNERLQGRSNPNVVRAAPDADQIALYAGTGILPAGDIIQVLNPFLNLDSRVTKGWDFGFFYDLRDTPIGDFKFSVNAARLNSFNQTPSAAGLPLINDLPDLLAAIPASAVSGSGNLLTAGDITSLAPEGFGEQLRLNGRPRWRLSGSINYKSGPVNVNLFGRYVGRVFDTSVSQNTTGDFLPVDDWFVMNASVSYTIEDTGTALDDTRIKFGFNNIFNEDPPIADQSFGFFSSLHSARGRQFLFEIQKKF